MQLDPLDRVDATRDRNPAPRLLIGALTLLGFSILAFALLPGLRNSALRGYASTGLPGATSDRFNALYKRLGVAPLSAAQEVSADLSPKLERLAKAPCDKSGVYALGDALAKAGEARTAAEIYAGFAASCANSVEVESRAARLYLSLGDYEKALSHAGKIIEAQPGDSNYHYLRGQAYAALKRYEEALPDYQKTIELFKEPLKLREGVFIEMANIYLALGKPCDAAKTILIWIGLDPKARATFQALRKAQEYAGRGCPTGPQPAVPSKI